MHMISAIIGLVGLAVTAYAAPLVERAALASDRPLQITNLTLYDPHGGNPTVKFNVYDPEPLTKNAPSATCTSSWAHGTDDYPKGTYVLCSNTAFAWNFVEWNGYQDFTIGINHRFTDPAVGNAPYNQVTVFGRGPYNKTVLLCEGARSQIVCDQKQDTIVKAPIYATTA